MNFYALPETCGGIIFDIDKTLYNNDIYAQEQIDVLIRKLAEMRAVDFKEMKKQIQERQKSCRSVGNAFVTFGIPIETSVTWREELIHPENYLEKDEKLREVLTVLTGRFPVMAVTNNPVKIGRKTLNALGVEDLFTEVFGLDTTMKSKPNPEIFRLAARRISCPPEKMISVGDRYAVDIEPALSIGMGGILVDGVQDVYALSGVLASAE